MDESNPVVRYVYTLMAAMAGAVTALAFQKWQMMSRPEIFLTLFTGASFAVFVPPWFAHSLLGADMTEARTIAALTYISAAGSNVLIPVAIEWLRRTMGTAKTPGDDK